MTRSRRSSVIIRLTAALLCAGAVLLPVAEGSAGASVAHASLAHASLAGEASPHGTVYWAEQAEYFPNWILPFDGLQYYSPVNINQFQDLMYRPLYWVGTGDQPLLNPSLSLAAAPVISGGGMTVSVSLKAYRWANGTKLDAQDVVFFMNMLRSEPYQFAGYVPGELPDNVTSVTATSPTSSTVTFEFTQLYNAQWLTLNELAQINPLPVAWDISKLVGGKPAPPGSGGCSSMTWSPTTKHDCRAVWKFLSDDGGESTTPHEAGDLATYATNPLWQIVDGPWHLSGYDAATGEVTMVPNPSYSGPVKPRIAKFVELPFSSATAEFNALAAGGTTAPDVGYLPLQNAPRAPKIGEVGPNAVALAANYDLSIAPGWQVNYFPINFNSNGDGGVAGNLFRQLYIRQALQELVNEAGIIDTVDKNYGVIDDGPVPPDPVTSFLGSAEKHNPYAYDPSNAVALLKAHAWTIANGKAATCSNGPKCGPGIPTGTKLDLTMLTASGYPALATTVDAEVAEWKTAGIAVTNKFLPFDEVLGDSVKCKSSQSFCSWEMADWGGGWMYTPDVVPTGEEQFSSTAGSNSGSYSNHENDELIARSISSASISPFLTWENYITGQLPVIWQPFGTSLTEVSKTLHGVTPANVLGSLTPEDWYFSS